MQDDGDDVHLSTAKDYVRFLLVSGKPVREPIAWHGPIVMNTDEELHTAFEEYRAGSFIKIGAVFRRCNAGDSIYGFIHYNSGSSDLRPAE